MNIFTITVTVASIFSGLFAIALNWSLGLDYSPANASFAPIALTWMLGIVAVSTWGGSIGAWYDLKDEN